MKYVSHAWILGSHIIPPRASLAWVLNCTVSYLVPRMLFNLSLDGPTQQPLQPSTHGGYLYAERAEIRCMASCIRMGQLSLSEAGNMMVHSLVTTKLLTHT